MASIGVISEHKLSAWGHPVPGGGRQAIRGVDPLKAPRRRIGVWLTHRRHGVWLTDRDLAPARGLRVNGQHRSRYLNISFRLGGAPFPGESARPSGVWIR